MPGPWSRGRREAGRTGRDGTGRDGDGRCLSSDVLRGVPAGWYVLEEGTVFFDHLLSGVVLTGGMVIDA